ncbi:MAG: hypothetical protein E6G87_11160, partial [Alphaproteobacteria bacterium]
ADRFGIPVLTFVDTAGAYPGIDAEERGQAEAIARSTDCCLGLGVPLVSVIIGEGGSGGAIAIATANAVLMLEHAIYSVISPEGAASILWRDATRAKDAASAMRITAQDLKKLGIIDDIIAEPLGGAHRGREQVLAATEDAISRSLRAFSALPPDALRMQRRDKFLGLRVISICPKAAVIADQSCAHAGRETAADIVCRRRRGHRLLREIRAHQSCRIATHACHPPGGQGFAPGTAGLCAAGAGRFLSGDERAIESQ